MLKNLILLFVLGCAAIGIKAGTTYDAITKTSKQYFLDKTYMCKLARIESNMNPKAKNKISSARGLFQITKATERAINGKYNISGDVFDPYHNSRIAGLLTRENVNFLKRKGYASSYNNLYAMHFFGLVDGYYFLKSKDNVKVKDILPRPYRYNKRLIGNKTVKELKDHFRYKFKNVIGCR